jgi:hypothetical protein
MEADLEGSPGKLSNRRWGYLLLLNGLFYILFDIILIYGTVFAGSGSDLPLWSWIFFILLIPLGLAFIVFSFRRFRKAKNERD